MAGTVLKSFSDATSYKLEATPKSAVKPPSHAKCEIERELVDLSVVAKTVAEAIVESRGPNGQTH